MESVDLESMKLADLFDLGWKYQRELSSSSLSEGDSEYIRKRLRALEILKKCEFMLDELHLFSENESLDEVSTSELRYFLNSALIGWLCNKVNNAKDHNIRLSALLEAKSSYLKYLALTKDYELHNYNVTQMAKDTASESASVDKVVLGTRQGNFDANMISQAYDRNEKIKRFKEQKELQKQIDAQSAFLDAAKRENVDDELRRSFYTSMIKYWINQSLDDLKCVDDEINILKSFEAQKTDNPETVSRMYANLGANSSDGPKPEARKPYIITKDAMQAKVFGAGYPSLPVYSIEEFYEMNVANDCCAPPTLAEGKGGVVVGGGVTETQKQDDKAKADALEDNHDEQELMKQRNWDEFKDENKRGAGNTYNRS